MENTTVVRFTSEEELVIANALFVAAAQYRKDAADSADNPRIQAAFIKQMDACNELLERIA